MYKRFDLRGRDYFSILDFTKILTSEYGVKPTIAFNLFKGFDIEGTGKITMTIIDQLWKYV